MQRCSTSTDGATAASTTTTTGGGGDAGAGPVVVHCVDGASQSGLFVACCIVCEKLSRDGHVDIFHTVKALKLKRFHFVNTLVKLGLVYYCSQNDTYRVGQKSGTQTHDRTSVKS